MLRALDVAEYVLLLALEEVGEVITNLKLQKLVYYAQGFCLALRGHPLFEETIEAWEHGPVIPELYEHYKKYENEPIPKPTELNYSKFDDETRELLNEVYKVYGQYSASGLRTLTHEESPWEDTQRGKVISHELMRDFFATQIINEPRQETESQT